MNSSIFLAILCIGVIVLAAVAALIYLLMNPQKGARKATQKLQTSASQEPRKSRWQIWILYAGIALILTIWTIWGALFFLAIVWVMRMNPQPYSTTISAPSDLDRDSVKGTYAWLLISPVLTIPTMLIANGILNDYSLNGHVLAALIPLIFHTPLLFRLNTKSLFVYRHAQLAILLVALRAGSAALAISMDSLWMFILVNGSLWLFGTMWARNQAVRKECSLMERKGEKILASTSTESKTLNHPSMDKELAGMLDSLNTDSVKTAKEKALHAFQTGTPTIKKRAVAVLDKLGEVEQF